MLETNVLSCGIAFLPLLTLLVTMIGMKWSAPRCGTIAWIVAILCGWLYYGANGFILGIACAKGLSLSLFVLLVIWSAVFLYNLVERTGGIGAIGSYISRLVAPRPGQALLLAWAFSGFVQGIAGFGVPVAVVVPLLLMLGFSPMVAVVSVLVGHSWAVTFGSMGSSYYTIQLVTDIPGQVIGPTMAILFTLPIIACGFGVTIITGGWRSASRGAPAVLLTGLVVSFSVWLLAYLGAAQIASLVPGLIGCGVVWLLSKTRLLGGKERPPQEPKRMRSTSNLGFHTAFLPYYLLILFSVISQVPAVKEATSHLYLAIDYPGFETAKGYIVEPAQDYAKIRLLNHPAPLILAAAFLTYIFYRSSDKWTAGAATAALRRTVKQCTPTSIGIATMVMMALIMTSTGMTDILARGIALVAGPAFPFFSPYIGVLGCFMTGSNTNSNVMFGALQVETALSVGISPLIIASIQSIGGSLGSAIAPAKVLIGSTLAGLNGKEGQVLRKAMPYCLAIVFLVSIEGWLATYIFR